jgi:hypothetical protein
MPLQFSCSFLPSIYFIVNIIIVNVRKHVVSMSKVATLIIGKSLYQQNRLESNVGEIDCLRNLFPNLSIIYEHELNLQPAEFIFLEQENFNRVKLKYNSDWENKTSVSSNLLKNTCPSTTRNEEFKHCSDQKPRLYLSKPNQRVDTSSTQILITDCITVTTLTQIFRWSRKYQPAKLVSVCVIDMDDVLIDETSRLYDGASDFIKIINSMFDKVILWSHGSLLHVDEHSNEILKSGGKFDLILGRQETCASKNLLHLYNTFTQEQIKFAVLIDDTPCNYTPEYNLLIVPKRKKIPKFSQIISLLNNR